MRDYEGVLAILIVLVLAVIIIASVNSTAETVAQGQLIRIIDAEAGVVCYSRPNYSATFSCLPISQTLLEVGK